jgi:hypothetical protein
MTKPLVVTLPAGLMVTPTEHPPVVGGVKEMVRVPPVAGSGRPSMRVMVAVVLAA